MKTLEGRDVPEQRVQKIMAQADIGSRRKCEEIIRRVACG